MASRVPVALNGVIGRGPCDTASCVAIGTSKGAQTSFG